MEFDEEEETPWEKTVLAVAKKRSADEARAEYEDEDFDADLIAAKRRLAGRPERKVDHPIRECVRCGDQFKPGRKDKKFCCNRCASDDWRGRK